MNGPVTAEALVDGDHDMPSEAEIQAMREEAENFRLPAPPPTPVRGRFYLTECEHCGWVGSSEHCGGSCGPDDDDIVCPVCCSSICGDEPDEADTAKHGEAVYQRIVTAEAERDAALAALQRVTAERDEARAEYERGLEHRNDLYDTVLSLRTSTAAANDRADTATAEAARLRGEVEAKDRALKPFADYADFAERHEWPKDIAEDPATPVLGRAGWDGEIACEVTVGDFQAARAATAREGQSDA